MTEEGKISVAEFVLEATAALSVARADILIEEEGNSSLCGVSTDARQVSHRETSEAIMSLLRGAPDGRAQTVRNADFHALRTERKPRQRRSGGWRCYGRAMHFMPAKYSRNMN